MSTQSRRANSLTHAPKRLVQSHRSGAPLPVHVREQMEGALHHDFSTIRVHEDSQPAKIGAVAYARGNHIHFDLGQYQPHTAGGRQVIAHELAHVVQQRQRRVPSMAKANAVTVNADSKLEAEANRAALSLGTTEELPMLPPTPVADAPVVQPMLRHAVARASRVRSALTRSFSASSGGGGGGGGDDWRRQQRELEAMKKASREAPQGNTPSTAEKFSRLAKYMQSRYPPMLDQSHPGAQDPMLRDYMVSKFSNIVNTMPEDEKAKAKATRAKYSQTGGPEPEVPADATPLDLALISHQQRQDKRIRTRQTETSPEALEVLEHAETVGFGNKNGETFEQMFARQLQTSGSVDAAANAISGSSKRANRNVQSAVGLTATDRPAQTPNEAALALLKKYYPQYFQGSGATLGPMYAAQRTARAILATRQATPEERRGPSPQPGREAQMETMLARMRRKVEDKQKKPSDEESS